MFLLMIINRSLILSRFGGIIYKANYFLLLDYNFFLGALFS